MPRFPSHSTSPSRLSRFIPRICLSMGKSTGYTSRTTFAPRSIKKGWHNYFIRKLQQLLIYFCSLSCLVTTAQNARMYFWYRVVPSFFSIWSPKSKSEQVLCIAIGRYSFTPIARTRPPPRTLPNTASSSLTTRKRAEGDRLDADLSATLELHVREIVPHLVVI